MTFTFEVEPPEVHLSKAPILRTLCQVQFAPVPELVDDANERLLASLLRENYPVRGWAQGMAIGLLPGGPSAPVEKLRTFEDTDGLWKITVASGFLALETAGYGSRADFMRRIGQILSAIAKVQAPPKVTRVGIRYTNRVRHPSELEGLVHPALLAWITHLGQGVSLEMQAQQTVLRDREGNRVLARSLLLPPGARFDPEIAEIPEESWVLDLDAFRDGGRPFDVPEISKVIEVLARRAYQVFHWSVTDKFRRIYGAEQDAEEQ